MVGFEFYSPRLNLTSYRPTRILLRALRSESHVPRDTPMTLRTAVHIFLRSCGAFLLCFALLGCGDTCFVVTGIFSNTTSATNPPTCKLSDGTGIIIVGINSARSSSAAPTSPNLQHIFITLRGIDASPNADASDNSPDWQELAPELASEPVQIDLMNTSVSGALCGSNLTRKAIIRAAVYRRIRLRLISDEPAAVEPLPKDNECGGPNLNCVVDTNGHTRALVMKNAAGNVLIASDHIADGSFDVLPNTETQLSIVFDPYSSLAVAVSDAVQVAPVFSAEAVVGCASSLSPR
jgi:hypothetical protein